MRTGLECRNPKTEAVLPLEINGSNLQALRSLVDKKLNQHLQIKVILTSGGGGGGGGILLKQINLKFLQDISITIKINAHI